MNFRFSSSPYLCDKNCIKAQLAEVVETFDAIVLRATLEFRRHCRHGVTENDGNDANDDKIGTLHVLSGAEKQDVGYI